MKDMVIERMEVIDKLRELYGADINSNITSVLICQNETDVYLIITYAHDTHWGKKTTEQTIALDFIADPYDVPLDIVPDGESCYEKLAFTPESSIENNAEVLFSDKVTLMNTTPLFD